jgi:hypothetical protein
MKNRLLLPLDFLESDDVLMLAGVMRERKACPKFDTEGQYSVLAGCIAVNLWQWWATAGVKVRPWRSTRSASLFTSASPIVWETEGLSFLLETACNWIEFGNAHTLCSMLLDAGILLPSAEGLELKGFAESNPHLIQGFVSHQARGGIAKARNKELRKKKDEAPKQLSLLRALPVVKDALPVAGNEDHQRKAVALIGQLDTACGKPERKPSEYTPSILRDALGVVGSFSDDDIVAVLERVFDLSAENKAVETEFILRDFPAQLSATKDTLP